MDEEKKDTSQDSSDTKKDISQPGKQTTIDLSKESLEKEIRTLDPSFENWDRYDIIEFLGEGGMGRVYKAFDPVLKRHVALKFLRGDDPEHARRLINEARAQAQIEHENVCKVYECDEVQGRLYIAMQFIEGQSLGEACANMTLEQKLKVLKAVAEGVHAAHRTGLIHRDIKPTNVMVEKTEDGTWKPYVMDFGLAREQEAPGMTSTGIVLGTPFYMAPEQVRGETRNLDRRTDVYSLGATFYEILTAHPPFEGESSIDVMMKVLEEDPPGARTINPSIPEDLETIVMKCLEKEPQRRYDSARALAEDIQRYLDGEPVMAKRASISYRWMKKAKKHKLLVAVIAVALTTIIAISIVSLRAQLKASQQAELAHEFGREVERVEAILRFGYLLPLHEAKLEKELVRERMNWIENQMKNVGKIGYGPGYYALGRGSMALHDYETARKHLEKAWKDHHYRSPEVSYALGLTMTMLYKEELQNAERIANRELRQKRKIEIEEQYKEPALQYIMQGSKVTTEAPEYVEAIIAFLEKKYEKTIQKTEEVLKRVPWLYEAVKLAGDANVEIGNAYLDQGEYENAMNAYHKASDNYNKAIEMGGSDATGYTGMCWIHVRIMQIQSAYTGESPKTAFENAMKACDNALIANPESREAYAKKALASWRWAEYQENHGEDPGEAIEQAIKFAQNALKLNQDDATSYNNLGLAYQFKADHELSRGIDPRESLAHSIEYQKKAISIDPNYIYAYNNLGNAYMIKAEYEIWHGLDPQDSLKNGIEALKKTIELNPDYKRSYNNLGIIYWDKGQYEAAINKDPRKSFQQAVAAFQKAIEIDPKYAFAHNNMGNVYLENYRYEIRNGLDSTNSMTKAIESYHKAASINPNYPSPLSNLASAYLEEALLEFDKEISPAASLHEARIYLNKALKIDSTYSGDFMVQANIELLEARQVMKEKKSPESFFKQAWKAIQQAMKLNPNHPDGFVIMAEYYYQQAEWDYQRGKSSAKNITQASAMLEKAFALNPKHPKALLLQKEWSQKSGVKSGVRP